MNLRDGIDKVVKEARQSKFGDLLPVEGYKLSEPYDTYNDYFADDEPITHSEREFNLATSNDRNIYDYVRGNRKALYDRLQKGEDYQRMLNEIRGKADYYKSWNPKNIRKEYLMRVLGDEGWWND